MKGYSGALLRLVSAMALFLGVPASLSGAAPGFLEKGVELLGQNKPDQAATFLEAALAQSGPSEKLYLYLGLSYAAVGKFPQAAKSFQLGAALKGLDEAKLLFNLGLIHQKNGDLTKAQEAYAQVLVLEPNHQGALLNRGNARLQAASFSGALADYESLLKVSPAHPQRPNLEKMVGLLKAQVAAEAEKAQLEEARKLAEEARQKTEALAKAEAEEAARIAEEKAAEQRRIQAEEAARLAAEKAAEEARLAAEKAAQEAEALAQAQEKARQEEAARKAAEEARLAEEARQREALLAKIRESLGGVTEDARTLKAGDKGVETVEEDVPLAD